MVTSNPYDVQIPATEIQIAEAIRVSDPDVADVIRRLAFQRDRLRARVAELEAQVEADDNERHEIVAGLVEQRDECRQLLREAVDALDNQKSLLGAVIRDDWRDDAAKAGGDGE